MQSALITPETMARDARVAEVNAMWGNTQITPGREHGPVSGDTIAMIPLWRGKAIHREATELSERHIMARVGGYVHTGFEAGAL